MSRLRLPRIEVSRAGRAIAHRVGAVPLLPADPRQGSKPNGRDAATVEGGTLRRLGSREPGRPGGTEVSGDIVPGWGSGYPEFPAPGRGARTERRYTPAILLTVERWRRSDCYGLNLGLMARDESVRRAICDHWLCAIVVYLDRERRRAWEAGRAALVAEMRETWSLQGKEWLNSVRVTDALFASAWVGLKQWWHGLRDRGLELTVNCLLEGTSVSFATLAEAREVERACIFAIDDLNMSIEIGMSFDRGETAVWAPGSPQSDKERSEDTPPASWGER